MRKVQLACVLLLQLFANIVLHICRRHICAFGQKQLGCSQSNARACASDHSDFLLESLHGSIHQSKTITLRAIPPRCRAEKPSLICTSLSRFETSWSSFIRPCM